jgi:F0F1-type ATP synthase membrane subunit c/vacuolar-type H+-ATPase subunit K
MRKRTWYILFCAFIASIGVYGLLVSMLAAQRASMQPLPAVPAVLRQGIYLLACACLLGAIGWMQRAAPGFTRTPLSPAQFTSMTIVALAMSEACAIFGLLLFMLGGPPAEFARFAIATVLVNLLFILPRGVRYWAQA